MVLILLWYFALWSPRSKALDQARQRRQTAQQQESQLRTEIARLRGAQREEPARRARLEALRTAIPDDPNLAQFILDTNDAATRAGIDFLSIAPSLPTAAGPAAGGAPAPGGATPTTTATTATTAPAAGASAGGGQAGARPAEIKLTLQIKGGYFQVLDFLNRLDALSRLVVTDGLNVASDPAARLTVSVTARTFVRSVPPAYTGSGAGSGAPGGTTATTTATTAPTAGGGR